MIATKTNDPGLPVSSFSQELIAIGLVTEDKLKIAKVYAKNHQSFIGESLIELGFCKAIDIQKLLSKYTGYPYVDIISERPDNKLFSLSPSKYRDLKFLPFYQDKDGLHIAISDPENVIDLDKIKQALGDIKLLLYHAYSKDILAALEMVCSANQNYINQDATSKVRDILLQAIDLGVSDIHFIPQEKSLVIQFRLDGVLRVHNTLAKEATAAVIVCIKIFANLDIAETRLPQSGHYTTTLHGRNVDFRVSTHPILWGEQIVIRVLDKNKSLKSLTELGFSLEDQKKLQTLARLPTGLILISGPTGSGKTTTLYAMISFMNANERNIMTIEDPVEYRIDGIRQTDLSLNQKISFHESLRSVLRHDPDVIFVSEIRDMETAQLALRAAMTGHLVLSTIHTVDTKSIINRMVDLGVSKQLLYDNYLAGISQRLLRKLCYNCKSLGCDICFQTGYKGRQAVLEIDTRDESPVTMSEKAKQLVIHDITDNAEVRRVFGKC